MISENPVPQAVFETFLNENPWWRDDADPEFFPDVTLPQSGVTGVSWFAAQAFCQWLGQRLPPSMAGWEVRLPTEAEWDAAPSTESVGWEWCADPFAPLAFIRTSSKNAEAVGSPERLLRSGAGAETRASLPPDFSSPFVSFRPVIAVNSEQ